MGRTLKSLESSQALTHLKPRPLLTLAAARACANISTAIAHMASPSLSRDVVDPERKFAFSRMYNFDL